MYFHSWHNGLASVLEKLPAKFLDEHECYFAGGTALVLQSFKNQWPFGSEYRLSNDLDFLCSQDAFQRIRRIVAHEGISYLTQSLQLARNPIISPYAIRVAIVSPSSGQPIKLEIVCDGYFSSHKPGDVVHGISCMATSISAAQKFTANCDRWPDRAIGLRDYIDLVALSTASPISIQEGLKLAIDAYDERSITQSICQAHALLCDEGNLDRFAQQLKLSSQATLFLATICLHPQEEALDLLKAGYPISKEASQIFPNLPQAASPHFSLGSFDLSLPQNPEKPDDEDYGGL